MDEEQTLVFAWTNTGNLTPIINGVKHYRPGILEALQGYPALGLLGLAVIAERASELGLEHIAIRALDEPRLLAFYRRLGAEDLAWKNADNLVALGLGSRAVRELVGYSNEYKEKG